jgi:hypothetical protein
MGGAVNRTLECRGGPVDRGSGEDEACRMAITKILRYSAVALPVAIGSIVRAFGRPAPGEASKAGRWRIVAALVPAALSFAVLLFIVFTAWSGYLYPLRPDTIATIGHPFTPDQRLAESWGGTTLVGAWFIHASIVLGWHVVCLRLLRLLAAWQGRMVDGRSGSGLPGNQFSSPIRTRAES